MINENALNEKKISLNDVFKLALKLKIPRQVTYKETETERHIIICGMFRVTQNKATSIISAEKYKLLSLETGCWVAHSDHFLKEIPIFYRGSVHVIVYILKDALSLLIKEIIELGYVITGNMNVGIYTWWPYNQKRKIQHKQAYFDNSTIIKTTDKTSFTYASDGLKIDDGYLTLKDKENIKIIASLCNEHPEIGSIDVALWSRFIFVKDYYVGLKTLNLSVRKLLNKKILSQFLKVKSNYLCQHGHSAFNQNLSDYVVFTSKFDIRNSIDGASPFLRLINPKSKKVCIVDGSNGQLMKLAKLDKYISRNDVKFLRKSNQTLSFFLSLVIEEKIKYSRRSTNIIKNKNFFSTMMTLIKNSLFSKLPVALRLKILTIFERNCTRWVREFHENDLPSLERIILKWLEYHKDLYKNIKYKNSKERWETETNYLDHALEWVIVVKPLIHKNQTWDSFHKLAVAWSLEVNGKTYSSYPTEWKPININPDKISDTYQIVEITNSEGLNKEGAEMLHCVYSYWGLCASGRYRVFSIVNEEERATLGLSIKKGGEKYILDQVRGMSNEAVSSNVKKVSKAILISVNAMCV